MFAVSISMHSICNGLLVSLSETDHPGLPHSAGVYSRGWDLAGSRLSGMNLVPLIEIAALGSGPLNKSYNCHVSPVSWTPPLTTHPCVLATPIQPLCADVSLCVAVCIAGPGQRDWMWWPVRCIFFIIALCFSDLVCLFQVSFYHWKMFNLL